VAWPDAVRQGAIIIPTGILTKSAGSLVQAENPAKILTISGIVVFCFGLSIALLGMGNDFKELR
jgi:hypothetical protein